MKTNHTVALNIASVHFAGSFLLGILLFMYFSGTALSDSYEPDPIWITVSGKLLWILQPFLCFLGTSPTHGNYHLNPLFVIPLGILWSLLFGYLVAWFIQILRNAK
jgi:hypothetical protein